MCEDATRVDLDPDRVAPIQYACCFVFGGAASSQDLWIAFGRTILKNKQLLVDDVTDFGSNVQESERPSFICVFQSLNEVQLVWFSGRARLGIYLDLSPFDEGP